jgi:hypothetical protein
MLLLFYVVIYEYESNTITTFILATNDVKFDDFFPIIVSGRTLYRVHVSENHHWHEYVRSITIGVQRTLTVLRHSRSSGL